VVTWNRGLTGRALDIAQCEDNPLRVMAGPGTGKSFAMMRRIARLLEVERVAADSILAVTFTRTAAAGLVKDLRGLGVPGCEQIRCCTLHSFCFGLLSKRGVFEYLDRVARPLISFNKSGVARFEAEPLLADLLRNGAYGGKREASKRIRAFEGAWARLQHERPGWPRNATDRAFHEELLAWLQFHMGMLIGELIPEALRFLRSNPESPELREFEHILVDEYQDLNKAEQILLDHLGEQSALAVVGDVDQSIYSFRFANPDGIVDFGSRHATTHDEELLECYRCPRSVVEIADQLIRNNHPARVPARLRPRDANEPGEVSIVQWPDLEDEAGGIAAHVRWLIDEKGYGPQDILVLSPRRLIAYGVRDALREAGVPVHSFFHEEALEELESQESFALLTLIAEPEDRVALRFWLGYGSPSWRSGEYAKLREHCEQSGDSPREALQKLASGELEIARTGGLVKRFEELLEWEEFLDGQSLDAVVDELFPEECDWARAMREAALLYVEGVETPGELLSELQIQVSQPEMPAEGEFVRVMSLHKSKGLTSKVAIVLGCLEGLTPTVDRSFAGAAVEANLREQRRLFYVAMTRCKERLVLSSVARLPVKLAYKIGARVRGRRGTCATVASRFLGELGPDAPRAVRGRDWAEGGYA